MQRLQRKAFGSCKWEVLLRNKKLHSDGLERVLCFLCVHGCLPASLRMNADVLKTRCRGAGEINWTNYLQGKALLRSDVTHEDKARVCNWHCYFISTSILKQ